MEDHVGTILYLVITFLILIASLFKKKKTKRAQNPFTNQYREEEFEPADQTPGGDSVENLLESFIQEEEEEFMPSGQEIMTEAEEKVPYRPEPTIKEGVTAFSVDDPSTKKVETGLLDSLATKGMDTVETEKKERKATELDGLVNDFELRKAVIYSEILKPKYF